MSKWRFQVKITKNKCNFVKSKQYKLYIHLVKCNDSFPCHHIALTIYRRYHLKNNMKFHVVIKTKYTVSCTLAL